MKQCCIWNYIILLFLNFLSFEFLFSQNVAYPPEWKELFSDSGWVIVREEERIKVYEKPISISPVPSIRVELSTSVSLNALLNVAWTVDQYPETLPSAYTEKAGFHHRNSAQYQQGWQIIDIPFLSPRLYQFDHIRRPSRIDWISAQFNRPTDFPEQLIIPPVNFGSWEVMESEGESKLIYRVCTDPGGIVPAWIMKIASRKYIPHMLLELEEAALHEIEK